MGMNELVRDGITSESSRRHSQRKMAFFLFLHNEGRVSEFIVTPNKNFISYVGLICGCYLPCL